MPFDRPQRTKNYVDLYEETKRGPRLLAFRIRDLSLPPEDGKYPDPNTGQKQKIYPVVADCMIIDGPNTGLVYMGKTYKFAITNALRGAEQSDPNATTYVGQEIAVRAERGRGTNSNAVFGNEPDDEEMEIIERVFTEYGGWPQMGTAPAPEPGAPAPGPTGPTRPTGPTGMGPGVTHASPAPARPGPAAGRPGPVATPAQSGGSGAARPFGPRRD